MEKSSIHPSINSFNQPMKQSINQPINQSIDRSIDQPTNQPISRAHPSTVATPCCMRNRVRNTHLKSRSEVTRYVASAAYKKPLKFPYPYSKSRDGEIWVDTRFRKYGVISEALHTGEQCLRIPYVFVSLHILWLLNVFSYLPRCCYFQSCPTKKYDCTRNCHLLNLKADEEKLSRTRARYASFKWWTISNSEKQVR